MSGGDVIADEDIGGVKYQLIKLVDGTAAGTARIGGDAANGLDVDVTRVADRASNGNAGSVATVFTMTDLQGMGTAVVQASAWGTATVIIEGAGDAGTTWTTLNLVDLSTGVIVSSVTAAGTWQVDVAGLTQLRARCSAFTSGTNTVNIRLANPASVVSLDKALPTGTNTIGNVGTIATSVTPGTAAANLGKAEDAAHTTGDVGVMALGVRRSDANSLTALAGADDDYIPLVTDSRGVLQVAPRPRAARVQVTSAGLTTVTTAYTIGDQAGTIFTFAGAAVATGGTGTILSAMLLDKGDVGSEYRLHVFRASVSLAADNAAFAVSDADMQSYIGTIQMPTMIDVGANRVSTAANIGLGYDCAATSLFVAIETRAANAVYAAATDLWLTLHLLLD